MKRSLLVFLVATLALCGAAFAKGGFSSGGGRGGFSSSSSFSRSSSFSSPSRSTFTTTSPAVRSTTVTTTTRSYSGGGYYGPSMHYGSLGVGHSYASGMLTGLLIGNMLHPANTVVYAGPGSYANNALLYPDGRVVSGSGQLVGNYVNGAFTPVDNGPIVAQTVPQQQAQPVVIHDDSSEVWIAFVCVALIVVLIFVMVA